MDKTTSSAPAGDEHLDHWEGTPPPGTEPLTDQVAAATTNSQTGQSPEGGTENLCPSGREDDPFGPTTEAPFGYKRDGTPKASRAGRPPSHGPRDTRPNDASATSKPDAPRIDTVSRAGPRKPVQKPSVGTITVDYESVAQGFAALWFTTGTIAFGADWQPDVEQREHIAVKDAIKRYVEARKIPDMPPGIGLCIVLTTYTLARLAKPTVKTRIMNIGAACARGIKWAKEKLTRNRS